MNKKTKNLVTTILSSILILFGLLYVSMPVAAAPTITIICPKYSDGPYFENYDTIYFNATVSGLQSKYPHREYVQYSINSGITWSSNLYPNIAGEVTIEVQEEAENLPRGNNTFKVRVKCLFDSDEWEESEKYEVGAWEVTIDSPSQNQFLDFDDVDHNVTLNVWKSDNITMYIKNPSTSQWKECRSVTTGYDDATQRTVDYFWIEYEDLTDSGLADVDYEDICYTSFEAKFTNRYKHIPTDRNFIDGVILNFEVIWNSVEFNISLNQVYTGTIGAENLGELYFKLESMQSGYYNTSTVEDMYDYTSYDYLDAEYWSISDYTHLYGNGKDYSSSGWWRKDSNGDVISTTNQRRCIELYDEDPGGDDLMHIFYFYFSTTTNHQNKAEAISGLDEDGSDGSIYWQVSRPDNDWGDYWVSIYFASIQLNPCRIEPS